MHNSNSNGKRFFALKYMKLYLNSCGVAVGKQNNAKLFPLYKYYLLTSFTILTYGQLMLYKDVRSVPAFAKTTTFVLSAFYLNFCTLNVHLKKKEFYEIMKIKKENFYIYSNLSYNLYGCHIDEKFRRIVRKYGKIWTVVYALIEMTPLIAMPFSEYKLGSPETLMIPCKFPWKIDSLMKYLLTYLFQVCLITPISLPVFGMVFFTVYFALETKAQGKKICSIIGDIKSSSKREAMTITRRKFAVNGDDFDVHRYSMNREISTFIAHQYDRISLEKLTQCLKHHQKILKFINNFVLYVEAMFVGDLIYSIGMITLSGYTLVGGVIKFSLYTQYVAQICCSLIYILLYCHLGELINDCNYHIREALYDTDWYNLNTNFRKTLVLFMCNTQQYRNLRASVSYVASYELFTGVIKGCYTYINLLKQSVSR